MHCFWVLRIGASAFRLNCSMSRLDSPADGILVERICEEPEGAKDWWMDAIGARTPLSLRASASRDLRTGGRRAPRSLHSVGWCHQPECSRGRSVQLGRLGANVPHASRRRLGAGGHGDLHAGGWVHLIMNGIALLALGEVVIYPGLSTHGGRVRAFSTGSILRVRGLVWTLLSVGASGAIFGLLGALAVIQWRHRRILAPGFDSRGVGGLSFSSMGHCRL